MAPIAPSVANESKAQNGRDNDSRLITTHYQTVRFLRATAGTAIARLSHRNSVRLSVRLSHGWIRQKRCKL